MTMLGTANNSAIEKMRRQELMTASPAQLTVKLFQRMILDLTRSLAAFDEGMTSAAGPHLVHAQAILSELDATLNTAVWNGADDLRSIYRYCLQTLGEANAQSDRKKAQAALDLLQPIASAFEDAARSPGL